MDPGPAGSRLAGGRASLLPLAYQAFHRLRSSEKLTDKDCALQLTFCERAAASSYAVQPLPPGWLAEHRGAEWCGPFGISWAAPRTMTQSHRVPLQVHP